MNLKNIKQFYYYEIYRMFKDLKHLIMLKEKKYTWYYKIT